jgi:glutamate dehydrogenase (NAD(P)+)
MNLQERAWGDQLGPELVLMVYDPESGVRGATVVDNSLLGPPGGGTRMSPDLTLEEIAELARTMTYKWGIFGIPRAGSKSGIWADPAMPAADKQRTLRAFGRQLRDHMVAREAVLGPDMGLTVDDVAHIYAGAGLTYPRSGLFSRAHEGDPAGFAMTGFGVIVAARAAAAEIGLPLDGARVAVQGFGQVGVGCARYAAREGARIVAVSTVEGAILDPRGLDVDRLLALRRDHGDRCVVEYRAAERIDPDALLTMDADVVIPAAGPRAIHGGNAGAIRARLVVSGGNNTVAESCLRPLHERGVIVVPDFVASAGGIIGSMVDVLRGTVDQAFRAMQHLMSPLTAGLVKESLASGVDPTCLARARVAERIDRARGRPRKSFAQAMTETRDLLGVF